MGINDPSSFEGGTGSGSAIESEVNADIYAISPSLVVGDGIGKLFVNLSFIGQHPDGAWNICCSCRNDIEIAATIISSDANYNGSPDLKCITWFYRSSVQSFGNVNITFSEVYIL